MMTMLQMGMLAILMGAAPADAARERKVVLDKIRPDGQVAPDLAQQTGWKRAYGFHWQMFVTNVVDGQVVERSVDPKEKFAQNQQFFLRLKAHADLWFYVLNIDPVGEFSVVLPEDAATHVRLEKNAEQRLPKSTASVFRLTDSTGLERLIVVASPKKLDDLLAKPAADATPAQRKNTEQAKRDMLARIRKQQEQRKEFGNADWTQVVKQEVVFRKEQGKTRDGKLNPPPDELGQDLLVVSPHVDFSEAIILDIELRYAQN